jgi:hypothetical protein
MMSRNSSHSSRSSHSSHSSSSLAASAWRWLAAVLLAACTARAARPDLVTCYVDWQGACRNSTCRFDVRDVAPYVSALNTRISACNRNPDRGAVSALLMNPGVDLVASLPCEGTTSTQALFGFTSPYDVSSFASLGAMYTARAACHAQLGAPRAAALRALPRFTTVMYNMQNMRMYGAADQLVPGPGQQETSVWVRPDRMLPFVGTFGGAYPSVLLHELGHTWGLQHSHSIVWEQGDCSCAMGCSDTLDTCFNAPNAARLGWSGPVAPEFAPAAGSAAAYELPVQTTAFASHLVLRVPLVLPAAGGAHEASVYLSVRSSEGAPDADGEIARALVKNHAGAFVPVQNRVSVHLATTTTNGNADDQTWFVDAIPAGGALDLRAALSGAFGLVAANPGIVVEHAHYDPARRRSSVVVRGSGANAPGAAKSPTPSPVAKSPPPHPPPPSPSPPSWSPRRSGAVFFSVSPSAPAVSPARRHDALFFPVPDLRQG